MKLNKVILIPTFAAAIVLTGCSKKTADSVAGTNKSTIEDVTGNTGNTGAVGNTGTATTGKTNTTAALNKAVANVNANRSSASQITGKMSMQLAGGGKSVSIGGNIKMKRDDVIQLSLQFLGLMEVGRIEMTQDYVLILNRHGKQYVKATYNDVPFFKENGINFFTFQSLFWDELFTLGGGSKQPKASDFEQTVSGDDVTLSNATKQVALKFLTSTSTSLLKQTAISPVSGKGQLQWNYSDWTSLDGKQFPTTMSLDAQMDGTKVNATFSLSRLRTDDNWKDTRTTIDTNKYKQITIKQAMAQIMSLTK